MSWPLSVPGCEGLVVALGDEVWTESSKICQRGLGSIGKDFAPVPSLVFSSRLSSEFTFPSGAGAGALALFVAILETRNYLDTLIFSN